MSGKEKGALTSLQQEILSVFKRVEGAKEFFFTGGAALSEFYLHHRISEDLDFFTPVEALVQSVSNEFISELTERGFEVVRTRNFKSFVELVVGKGEDSTRVQFALESPYRLDTVQVIDGMVVDSILDMAAGKLLALFGRAAERDFVDIYFLIKDGFCDLDLLIQKALEKDPGVDKYFLAIAFEQVRSLPDNHQDLKLKLFKPVDMKELKRFFVEKAVRLLDEAKKP